MRCLRGIVDPYPTKTAAARVWEFFQSKCAYCGHEMKPSDRKGHQDHLIAFKHGGTNDLGNYVLACGACNGDEKLAERWETYLRQKNAGDATFLDRKAKIEKWVALNTPNLRNIPDDHRQAVLDAYERIAAVIDAAVSELRSMKPPKVKKAITKVRCTSRR
jgi:hypothetical protein